MYKLILLIFIQININIFNNIIENEFSISKFDKLSKEQLNFVEVFLVCRGNIKDVEKQLGISYPTVRGKLDEINNELGLAIKKDITKEKERIMVMLENKEINSEEAVNLLKNL